MAQGPWLHVRVDLQQWWAAFEGLPHIRVACTQLLLLLLLLIHVRHSLPALLLGRSSRMSMASPRSASLGVREGPANSTFSGLMSLRQRVRQMWKQGIARQCKRGRVAGPAEQHVDVPPAAGKNNGARCMTA